MKLSRRYQPPVDLARCWTPGCTWHREGPTAEPLGEAHTDQTGHEVRVSSTSTVIFTTVNRTAQDIVDELRHVDTPRLQASRRAALEEAAP